MIPPAPKRAPSRRHYWSRRFFVFTYVLTILHWKSRYKGDHSDLWGVLLLIETSGWLKIVYHIRHLLPDMMGKGRYEPL